MKEGESGRHPPSVYEKVFRERFENHPLREDFHDFVSNVYPAPGEQVDYVVQRGDSLGGISNRFKQCGVKGPQHLMLYNGLTSSLIRPGQRLAIPCSE